MFHPVECCGIRTRVAVVGIGIVSTFSFVTYIVVILLGRDVAMTHVTETQFYLVLIGLGVMGSVSVLLLFAVICNRRCLLFPYMILTGITVMVQLFLLFATVIYHGDMLSSSAAIGAYVLNICLCLCNFWFFWIVVVYYHEEAKITEDGYNGLHDEETPFRRPNPPPRDHGLKPTIVSKLLHNYESSSRK